LSIAEYATVVTTGIAAAGVLWGVYQYRKGQIMTRQKVLFEAIKEFNESKELQIAKDILGYGYVRRPKENKKENDQTDLKTILRYPKKDTPFVPVTDPAEIDIRNSFDALIVFLGKIGYMLMVGVITRNEALYFRYYIGKIQDDDNVRNYTKENQFPLYKILLDEFKKSHRFSKAQKYERYVPIVHADLDSS
jgi:hypothetical protein